MKKLLTAALCLLANNAFATAQPNDWEFHRRNPQNNGITNYYLPTPQNSAFFYLGVENGVATPEFVDGFDPAFVGLGEVDNTSDLDKPVSTATQAALSGYVPTSRTINGVNLSANRTFTLDAFADGTTNKAFTAAMLSKLNGIASGATQNDTDANLRARSSHTGTQAATTIVEDSTHRFATDAEKTTWNAKFNTPSGTSSQCVKGDGSVGSCGTATVGNVYVGATSKTGLRMIAKTATVSTGNAVFHLTDSEASGGNALCANGNVYLDSMMVRADNEVDTPFSFGQPALSNSNKTITIAVKKAANVTTLPIIGTLTGALLGAPVAANGSVVKSTVWCD